MSATPEQTGLDRLVFNNRFSRELPADDELQNKRRQVHGACFSYVAPTPVSSPKLIAWSREMAETLGLDETTLRSSRFADVFTGNALLEGMEPYAMCYGGHQFGHWAGQLGDGRAINLGEVETPSDGILALQLKGAGPTPYSRTADGLAVLRSSVREFLCSEAMFHLGVPTTRALSLTLTGESVIRDMFYDGNPQYEPGAVVCRVAPSFLRLGNYEIFAARKDIDTLRQLVDFTLRHFYPELGDPGKQAYIAFFQEVCRRTAAMIVHWQRVGFVHGVMNTDNLSILGLTIDYGPYGWLEDYNPGWTPNTTDAEGRRYAYGNQPAIGQWNLVQFANSLYPLIGEAEPLQEALSDYAERFNKGWNDMMASKLGLSEYRPQNHESLIDELLTLLEAAETDMTLFFRGLSAVNPTAEQETFDKRFEPLLNSLYSPDSIDEAYKKQAMSWLDRYYMALDNDSLSPDHRKKLMDETNPLYVLRNYLAQLAIDRAGEGDYSLIAEQLEVLRNPYTKQAGMEKFAGKRPDWARNRAGCSMLSCSS
ncbi:MAG: YdiU family protein [Gammaproteobacteria bacterium]|nr:YdiU family protein [Gammaproteobacteria bacterium]